MHDENYLIKSETLEDIADAIREKKQSQDTIAVSDFATEIENLPSGGGKYAPRTIRFQGYQGNNLDYEVENLDTSNITDMNNMFNGCSNITNLNLSNFNTENVTSFSSMFASCGKLNTVNINNFDTAKIRTISNMFNSCSSLTNIIGLDNLTFPNITDANQMFISCASLTSLNLNMQNIATTDFSSMCNGCSNLVDFSLSNSTLGSLTSMFSNCPKLKNVNFSDIKSINTTYLNNMFNGCSSLTTLDLSWFNPTKRIYGASNMFSGCTSLTHIDLRNWSFNISSYTNMFGASASTGVPDDCEIIVKDDTEKAWINTNFSRLTNVKTVAEYEAE